MSILSTYVRMVHKNKSDAARLIFYSFFVKVIIHSLVDAGGGLQTSASKLLIMETYRENYFCENIEVFIH